jgi:hypothetical protein
MKTRWMLVVFSLIFPILVGLAGCSDDDDDNQGVDPETPFTASIPSTQSMELEVNDLQTTGLTARPAGLCHGLTSLAVAWINLNVVAHLAIPEAVLAACLQQPSTYLGNSRWQWTCTGGQGGGTWTAVLAAQVEGGVLNPVEEVSWEMQISGTTLALDDALWFDGNCDVDAREGVWIFYDPQSVGTPQAVIRSEWDLSAAAEEDRTLTFEAIDAGTAIYGDELAYALIDSIGSITYFDASASATFAARWDLRDGSGRAISAQGDTCCWGARNLLFPDVDCP